MSAAATKVDFPAPSYGMPVDYKKEKKAYEGLLEKEQDETRRMLLKNKLAYINVILNDGVNKYQFGEYIIFRNEQEYRVFPKGTCITLMAIHLQKGDCLVDHRQFLPELF